MVTATQTEPEQSSPDEAPTTGPTAEEPTTNLRASIEAIRAAGGDGWDKIDDPAEFLGRKDDEKIDAELARLRAALAAAGEDSQRIRESRQRIRNLEVRMLETKQRASDAKKAYETALDAHLALEDEIDSGQARLPLGEPETAAEATEDDSWREVWIEDLGLSSAIVKALNDGGLQMIGELADYTAADKQLTDIEGIGAVKAERIEEALTAYWAAHPQASSVNQELLDGVREVEGAKAADSESWREITIEQLHLPVALGQAFLGEGRLTANDVQVWLDALMTPGSELARNQHPDPHLEKTIGIVKVALAAAKRRPADYDPASDWRHETIDVLARNGMAPAVGHALRQHDIETVGEVVGLCAERAMWLTAVQREQLKDALKFLRNSSLTRLIANRVGDARLASWREEEAETTPVIPEAAKREQARRRGKAS